MTTYIHNGVRYNVIAVEGFWRVTVKGLTLGERFITLGAAIEYARVWIDQHEEG